MARTRAADLDDLKLGDMLRQSAIEGARRFLAGFEEGRQAAATKRRRKSRRRAAASLALLRLAGPPRPLRG